MGGGVLASRASRTRKHARHNVMIRIGANLVVVFAAGSAAATAGVGPGVCFGRRVYPPHSFRVRMQYPGAPATSVPTIWAFLGVRRVGQALGGGGRDSGRCTGGSVCIGFSEGVETVQCVLDVHVAGLSLQHAEISPGGQVCRLTLCCKLQHKPVTKWGPCVHLPWDDNDGGELPKRTSRCAEEQRINKPTVCVRACALRVSSRQHVCVCVCGGRVRFAGVPGYPRGYLPLVA